MTYYMRTLSAIFTILFAALSSSQAYGQQNEGRLLNFVLDGRELIWCHVFETERDSGLLMSLFQSRRWSEHRQITWDTSAPGALAGTFYGLLNYKPYEVNALRTPSYIMTSPMSCTVTIEVRDGRYRVTLSNIRFDTAYIDNLITYGMSGAGGAMSGEYWKTIEHFAIRNNGRIRTSFRTCSAPLLDNIWLHEYEVTSLPAYFDGGDGW